MTRLVLGVIGHVDHGKTALVRALTGEETDRLAEEKARGISIALGFAQLRAGPDIVIDLIDMPGHERFVRTMIAGATGIDAVLLVVAANEGIKPQTTEHVEIAGLLGLRRAVIAISKTDLVAPARAAEVADEAVRLVEEAGLEPLPPILTAATRQQGIAELTQALAGLAGMQRPRSAEGLAFLPIDRAFSIAGHGPVVTGTLRGAPVSAGEMLDLLPANRPVRVRAVQLHGSQVASAAPGQRVALNLRGAEAADLQRGMVLAAPGSLAASDWLTLCIKSLKSAPALKNGKRLRALLGTEELDVRLRLLDRDVLEPGESGFAQLHGERAVALPAGEHVILRLASPARTVAGGRVLEAETIRRRRHDAVVLQRLEELGMLPAPEMIAAEILRAGRAGVPLRHISRLSGLALPRIVALLQALPVTVARSSLAVQETVLEAIQRDIPALLARHAMGLTRTALLAAMPGTSAGVLDEALARLAAAGAIILRGSQINLRRPDEERARAEGEAALAARIAETLRQSGLTPPTPAELMTDLASKRAIDRLLREGIVVRAVERAKGKEILFHQDAIGEAQRRLAPLLTRVPGLLVTEVGAALGISRKYSMPLLDHLDSIRFTRRIGDRRILAAAHHG